MVDVIVEFDYEAQEPDELTLKKGDIIKDVTKKKGGWWRGTLNDKTGMFPDNFVRNMDSDAPVVLRNKKDVARIRKCRVIFSYNQDHEDELSLKVGEVIDIIGEEEEGWWRGFLNGKEGVFPSNFVQEIVPAPPIPKVKPAIREDLKNGTSDHLASVTDNNAIPVLPSKPVKQLYEVKFYYKSQNPDELNLNIGDIVTLLNKDGQDPGWWKGEVNGKIGVFPDNFVEPFNDKSPTKYSNAEPPKQTSVASQRKSLEVKHNNSDSKETKTTPPVPGKKPFISLKKSPSGSGLLSEIKKKIVDVVDGATGSKNSNKNEENNNKIENANIFDQVERRPLLPDVRATRAKAPGRRPPTVLLKDDIDIDLDTAAPESPPIAEPPIETSPNSSMESDDKPKLREWEKHKAPWLAEMKLNQAKRTPAGPEHKLKLTTSTENIIDTNDGKEKVTTPTPVSEPEKPAAPPPAAAVVRSKPVVPTPVRGASMPPPVTTNKPVKVATVPVPVPKVVEKERISDKQYMELLERVQKLEELLMKQEEKHASAIEELKGKLQLECEMRMLMQAELEKVVMRV